VIGSTFFLPNTDSLRAKTEKVSFFVSQTSDVNDYDIRESLRFKRFKLLIANCCSTRLQKSLNYDTSLHQFSNCLLVGLKKALSNIKAIFKTLIYNYFKPASYGTGKAIY